MRRSLLFALLFAVAISGSVQAQVGQPGIEYSGAVAAGDGGQLYPYDQQDPWLHGYYQRIPAYGGFVSFRPYNYRHVFAQTQIANTWGLPHGMPYSQQFWNKYRGNYLQGHLHSQAVGQPGMMVLPGNGAPVMPASAPIYQTSYHPAAGYPYAGIPLTQYPMDPMNRPVHVLPVTAPVPGAFPGR